MDFNLNLTQLAHLVYIICRKTQISYLAHVYLAHLDKTSNLVMVSL